MTARDKSCYEERSTKLFHKFIYCYLTLTFGRALLRCWFLGFLMILRFCRVLLSGLVKPAITGQFSLPLFLATHRATDCTSNKAILFPQINETAQAPMIQICSQMGDRDMMNHQIHKVHHPRGATESWDKTTPYLIEISVVWILKCRGFLPRCSYHRCPVQPCNFTRTKMLKVGSRFISFGQNHHLYRKSNTPQSRRTIL